MGKNIIENIANKIKLNTLSMTTVKQLKPSIYSFKDIKLIAVDVDAESTN